MHMRRSLCWARPWYLSRNGRVFIYLLNECEETPMSNVSFLNCVLLNDSKWWAAAISNEMERQYPLITCHPSLKKWRRGCYISGWLWWDRDLFFSLVRSSLFLSAAIIQGYWSLGGFDQQTVLDYEFPTYNQRNWSLDTSSLFFVHWK